MSVEHKLVFLDLDSETPGTRELSERSLNEFATHGYLVAAWAEERDESGTIVGWELILERNMETVVAVTENQAQQLTKALEALFTDRELNLSTPQLYRARDIVAQALREVGNG